MAPGAVAERTEKDHPRCRTVACGFDIPVTGRDVISLPGGNPTVPRNEDETMNAITANAPHASARNDDATTHGRRRRRAIIVSVGAAFLGAYVLGVSWVGNALTSEMERNLQGAPAVVDVQHRS